MIIFDKTEWETSEQGDYGFNKITIHSLQLLGKRVRFCYEIDTNNYMKHLDKQFRILEFSWDKDKSNYLNNDNFRLILLNLLFQSFAAISVFSRKLDIPFLSDPVWAELIRRNARTYQNIETLFHHTAEVERNNMRYAMGLVSTGYVQPKQSVMDEMGKRIGNFHNSNMGSYAGVLGNFNWSDHTIDKKSKVLINLSFGKESLATFNCMEKTVGLDKDSITLNIFQHTGDNFQSTYKDVAKEAPYANYEVNYITSNFLDTMLVPICDVRLGGPICMLTHVFNIASQLAHYGEGFTHILSGDEYERNLVNEVKLSSEANLVNIYSYDYEQSPRYHQILNNIHVDLGGFVSGSVLYGITGYQAQMLLDLGYNFKGTQISCHDSHVHNGNCGYCQKCIRVGTVKYLMGNPFTIDYNLPWKNMSKLLYWSMDEFFVTYLDSREGDSKLFLANFQHIFLSLLAARSQKDHNRMKSLKPEYRNTLAKTQYNRGRPPLLSPELQRDFLYLLSHSAGVAAENYVKSIQ